MTDTSDHSQTVWRLDPFQTIVNVQWGGPVAAMCGDTAGFMAVSPDGINWKRFSNTPFIGPAGGQHLGVICGGWFRTNFNPGGTPVFILGGEIGPNTEIITQAVVAISSDPGAKTPKLNTTFAPNYNSHMMGMSFYATVDTDTGKYSGKVYIAIENYGTALQFEQWTSPDGITWTMGDTIPLPGGGGLTNPAFEQLLIGGQINGPDTRVLNLAQPGSGFVAYGQDPDSGQKVTVQISGGIIRSNNGGSLIMPGGRGDIAVSDGKSLFICGGAKNGISCLGISTDAGKTFTLLEKVTNDGVGSIMQSISCGQYPPRPKNGNGG